MPSIETSIWLALKGRVQTLTLSPALPIAWPNEDFTKPITGYLRVTHVPNTNRRLFIGSTEPHQRLGLLQLDVFSKKNQDASIGAEMAGQVAAWFPTDLRMIYGAIFARVTEAPVVAQPIADDTHWLVPVTISYECFA
ncbi:MULTISPECIES: DUF4128 domain-containing protein [unclassified Mesorhizobium]|uniref:DUF4128 domain-containing protein n=1 Tax=unclassified Mesorhizobium TaxID=325217 RepID=UPI000BAE6E92|nr:MULTISPECIES: DUF4128 domain-containing protein [unclassified Mesorhizobium]PBC23473.1 hypothetical protein CK226_10120 [Mesorhizobium sp. WSM4311]TRD06839.1 hypothetical protein FJV82_08915 [Mesorhizobium sp. WSM4305]